MPSIAALVPMRHHSQRVPGKNYRPLAGKPLYQYIIETLMNVPEISAILVDTDSEPVIEGLRINFPNVQIIKRPEHLRADAIPMNEILTYDTDQFQADYYLQTHSTNPLLRAETLSKGIHSFLQQVPVYDSMFSVTRLQTRLWDGLTRAIGAARHHGVCSIAQQRDAAMAPAWQRLLIHHRKFEDGFRCAQQCRHIQPVKMPTREVANKILNAASSVPVAPLVTWRGDFGHPVDELMAVGIDVVANRIDHHFAVRVPACAGHART